MPSTLAPSRVPFTLLFSLALLALLERRLIKTSSLSLSSSFLVSGYLEIFLRASEAQRLSNRDLHGVNFDKFKIFHPSFQFTPEGLIRCNGVIPRISPKKLCNGTSAVAASLDQARPDPKGPSVVCLSRPIANNLKLEVYVRCTSRTTP